MSTASASASSVVKEDAAEADSSSTIDTDGVSHKRKCDKITNISVVDTEEAEAELSPRPRERIWVTT
jgi:hypothetical protein